MKAAYHVLLSTLAIGISKCQMYSSSHQAVEKAAAKIIAILEEIEAEDVEIMVVEGELVVNNVLLRDSGLHGAKLMRMLKAKGISRIDFLKETSQEEMTDFIIDVADADKELGKYSSIQAGVASVRLGSMGLSAHVDLTAFNEEQLARVEAVYGTVSPFRELEIASLEEIVANFLVTFRRGANVLRMISPVKSHSEYTYTHAMNVAVLSLSQAEYLGLEEELTQEVGIAALMHDVGKLSIPTGILHKDGALSEEEFGKIKRHTLLGAAYLMKADGAIPLAPIVALEHHRRFDGTGYPILIDNGRRQHIASQIVAIADFFDALRSNRPYRKSLGAEEILHMMKEGSGSLFNPDLLDNFAMILLSSR